MPAQAAYYLTHGTVLPFNHQDMRRTRKTTARDACQCDSTKLSVPRGRRIDRRSECLFYPIIHPFTMLAPPIVEGRAPSTAGTRSDKPFTFVGNLVRRDQLVR